MNIKKSILLLASHATIGVIGFALGIYTLPILTAPASPTEAEIRSITTDSRYSAIFIKDLKDSDAFHWGDGRVVVGPKHITLMGKLAPGPDYKLYLSPEFVETEIDFNRLKSQMVQVGDVRTFDNFIVEIPGSIDPGKFTSVIVWCESFGEFITAAQYR
ncbi:MAG: DM13 domain-containing protein [Gammaproteobacteria bacterium]|nr:DM13 domain-containing protein [Gammaproteobacteria bacterium]NNJ92571.1 DM13 domain-containing protein [Gammaproteobacteria bacterium]